MKGTEKQIALARDILSETVKKVDKYIEDLTKWNTVEGIGLDKGTQKKIDRYNQAKAMLTEDSWENASDVIEADKGWHGLIELVVNYVCFPENWEN